MATKKEHNLIIAAYHGTVTEYEAARRLKTHRVTFASRMKQWVKAQVKAGTIDLTHLIK